MLSATLCALWLSQSCAAAPPPAKLDPATREAMLRVAYSGYDPKTGMAGTRYVEGAHALKRPDGVWFLAVVTTAAGGETAVTKDVSADLFALRPNEGIKGTWELLGTTSLPWSRRKAGSLAVYITDPDLDLGTGKRAFSVSVGTLAEDGGASNTVTYLVWDGAKFLELLSFNENGRTKIDGTYTQRTPVIVCRSATEGVADVDAIVDDDICMDGDDACSKKQTIRRYRWTGDRFQVVNATMKCEERSQPKVPAYVDRATASSTLKERGLPEDYHSPLHAIDGLMETAWVEGGAGPGAGQWWQVELKEAMALKAILLSPGCGATKQTWDARPRLRRIRLTYSDGATQDVMFGDAGLHEVRKIDVARDERTLSLRVEILEVYPGTKTADACISEVSLVPREAE